MVLGFSDVLDHTKLHANISFYRGERVNVYKVFQTLKILVLFQQLLTDVPVDSNVHLINNNPFKSWSNCI